MTHGPLRSLLLLAPILAVAAEPALTPVLDDSFHDGGFTNGNDPLDTGWLRSRGSGGVVMAIGADPGLAGGPALVCQFDSSWGKIAAPLGAAFGLGGPGTRVRLEFRIRLRDDTPLRKLGDSPNRGLPAYVRFGLYASDSAIRQDGWGAQDGLSDGFGATLSLANTATATNATGAAVFVEQGDSQEKHDVLGGPTPEGLQNLGYAKAWNGLADTQPHRVAWTLTQTAADLATLTLELDDRPLVQAKQVDLRGRPRTFDTLVFGLNGVPGHLALDDVRVLVAPD